MTALILASGKGTRMGRLTERKPKCMTELAEGETIISRQLRLLGEVGASDIIVTTGAFADVLTDYAKTLKNDEKLRFIHNALYDETNYIYSMFLAAEAVRDKDLLLMHGDLVFEKSVLEAAVESRVSCMAVSSTAPLPDKDFKAVVEKGKISAVGTEFFENAIAAQPLYKLRADDSGAWFSVIKAYCESNDTNKRCCYAENALNEIAKTKCSIFPLDIGPMLCCEIDTPEDLLKVRDRLK